MPDTSDDDFSYMDLKGYIATDRTHGELGEIIEVNEYPQQFVATVHYKFTDVLFPLNEDIIVEIDEDEGTILLDLPDGLLEIYTSA